jgi:hypothetical protein
MYCAKFANLLHRKSIRRARVAGFATTSLSVPYNFCVTVEALSAGCMRDLGAAFGLAVGVTLPPTSGFHVDGRLVLTNQFFNCRRFLELAVVAASDDAVGLE